MGFFDLSGLWWDFVFRGDFEILPPPVARKDNVFLLEYPAMSQTFQHQTIRETGARFYPLSRDTTHIANRKSNGEMRDIIFHLSRLIFII